MNESHEVWRPIADAYGYEVSNRGRVRSWRRRGSRAGSALASEPRILKTSPNAYGYPVVNIARKGERQKPVAVHILVLTAFQGPPPHGMECLHDDGNRLNANLDNLSWGTRRDNKQDSARHGTDVRPTCRGEKSHLARLRDHEVRTIKAALARGASPTDLASTYKVHLRTITSIRDELSWSWMQ